MFTVPTSVCSAVQSDLLPYTRRDVICSQTSRRVEDFPEAIFLYWKIRCSLYCDSPEFHDSSKSESVR
ncbi:hypothetical protein TSAR_012246 [Trichomalopsis sarcophagae]|uniref:Uncharacterized protein n=1 Tax=Trichomalopsis sarcophagae TaxID=543379 RepID=A0A232EVF9_9HYME|nr:hypothetical protein TSAR_012246 [Trichomalopsis sarcophagae]